MSEIPTLKSERVSARNGRSPTNPVVARAGTLAQLLQGDHAVRVRARVRCRMCRALELSANAGKRPISAREQRRRALERDLETAVRRADREPNAAFKLELDEGEKAPTIRLAFLRVKERLGSPAVNLFSRDGALFIAKRPQTRGRGGRRGRTAAA